MRPIPGQAFQFRFAIFHKMQPGLSIKPIVYQPESALWFLRIRHLPSAVWLDSGRPGSPYGRFDILSAAPQCLLETSGETTRIRFNNGHSEESAQNPFTLLKKLLPVDSLYAQPLPFTGGALGYFGYDVGRRLEKMPSKALPDISLPDLRVGIYPWAIVQDHELQQAWLVTNEALSNAIAGTYNFSTIEALFPHALTETFQNCGIQHFINTAAFQLEHFKNDIDREDYSSAIAKIKEYIYAGDCYQVNFAQRFSAEFRGDSLVAYLTLREVLPSPFSGYLQLEDGAILSLSPERFIQVKGRQVETKPIKGTINRGATPDEDAANAHWLEQSPKNYAENVMIVDLLRNDLSKHCVNVRVPELCKLQTFANVHHLVSTVTAELNGDASAIDVLRDSFPGGSITGAPKIRAMEIIEELEPVRRSIYCGSLGYISTSGQMDTSIAIRTLVCDKDKIYCWGGGGIVADSETEQEYRESIAKVKVLMDTLERNFSN